ncbi:GNAT family N-acetyltransferase [Clostridium amazonitimonense]|uniref:GNAT family N-acetyltransferase n=1 Tax=Clostridium amazonitimonense TaxID=1499689 RepID=UPI0005096299|nr:GNAT family N-acetyltransferase [Clostridium amazonitimonense]
MKTYLDICKKTKQLEVRPVRIDDYSRWIDGFINQKPKQNQFDEGPFVFFNLTEEWLEKRIEERKQFAAKDEMYKFGVFRSADSAHIGFCVITTHMRDDFQYASVGYSILNQYWGNGYGAESLKALIQIGFADLDFHRLEAHINTDNLASKRVALKAGMEFECVREGFIFEDGEWTDNEIYFINNQFKNYTE